MTSGAANIFSSEGIVARSSDAQQCVLPYLLDRQAENLGDKPLFLFHEGPTWTYAEARRIARGTAATFEKLGISRGDRVLVFLADGPDIVRISLALTYLGAVMAPLNPELSGEILSDLIDYSDARLLVTSPSLFDAIKRLGEDAAPPIIVLGDNADVDAGMSRETVRVDPLPVSPDEPSALAKPLQPWDVHTLFFTSGTTGVSKGVESTHAHCAAMAIDGLHFLTGSDRFCTPCGYFHVGGAYAAWGVISAGASMVVVGKFSATRFMHQMASHDVTVALLIGVMCDFLLAQPPRVDDATGSLRSVISQPLPNDVKGFAERFGVTVYTQFDQTETPPAIQSPPLTDGRGLPQGYCGRLRGGYEARIVDDYDQEVPVGQSGELVLRCSAPWVIATGYFRKPEETAHAWRNGWFHTGDVFRRDTDGNFCFVDRSKDVIRRRGENISSFDIERALTLHPAVEAAAAFGVANELSEQDVMAVVQLSRNCEIDHQALLSEMGRDVPTFMLPRYLRIVPELPRSATDKVQKYELYSAGVTPDTWDREAGHYAREAKLTESLATNGGL